MVRVGRDDGFHWMAWIGMIDRLDKDVWLWKVGWVGKVDWIGRFGLVRGFDCARWSWEVEWFGLVKEFD